MGEFYIISQLLYKLYRIKSKKLRRFIRRMVLKIEHGQILSTTIRRIYSDYHKIEIGMYSYGGCFDLNHIWPHVKIGRYCSIASGVHIINIDHPITYKSSHPLFYLPRYGCVKEDYRPRTHIYIGNDVWIGNNAIILSGVRRIGDGAVVGAGAVVTKDVPDFAVVVGNPAKVIKYRFSSETIKKIRNTHWWEKSFEELKGDLGEFLQPLENSK
jgi:virginiamycin A acetyltransferase